MSSAIARHDGFARPDRAVLIEIDASVSLGIGQSDVANGGALAAALARHAAVMRS
jgi:hypothetical protein